MLKLKMKATLTECVQLLISCFGVMTSEQFAEAKRDYFAGKGRREREERNANRRKRRKKTQVSQ